MNSCPHRYISPRMLIRDLLRRYPDVALVLRKHQVDPAYTYLSLELAAQAAVRPHAC
jgi:hypothetical protein